MLLKEVKRTKISDFILIFIATTITRKLRSDPTLCLIFIFFIVYRNKHEDQAYMLRTKTVFVF